MQDRIGSWLPFSRCQIQKESDLASIGRSWLRVDNSERTDLVSTFVDVAADCQMPNQKENRISLCRSHLYAICQMPILEELDLASIGRCWLPFASCQIKRNPVWHMYVKLAASCQSSVATSRNMSILKLGFITELASGNRQLTTRICLQVWRQGVKLCKYFFFSFLDGLLDGRKWIQSDGGFSNQGEN